MITRELEAQWRRESIVAFDIFAMRCLITDEVQAEEDALIAAELMDKKIWLEHPESHYGDYCDDLEFEVEG